MISYSAQQIGSVNDKLGEIKEKLIIAIPDNEPKPERFSIMQDLNAIEELLKDGVVG